MLAPLGQLVIYGALNIQDFQLGVPELLGLILRNQSVTGFAFALLQGKCLKGPANPGSQLITLPTRVEDDML